MNKTEQNEIIKSKLVEHLQIEDNIPADIGETYRNWLVNKINEANLQTGEQQLLNFVLSEGNNNVSFSGTGSVKITYRQGAL